MIAAGICLLVIGALWEVAVFWSGAWPSALTWLLMGVGLAMTAIGCTRARARAMPVAWIALGLFVLTVILLWASG